MSSSLNIVNKRASFEYFIVNKYSAGIVLTGSEIKSVREGKVSLTDSYCFFQDGELWVKSMHIAEYKNASFNNHDPRRTRKLLMKKQELRKLQARVREKSMTIVPVAMYLSDKGFAKLDVALVKGKKKHDKRDTIKKKDVQRDLDRSMKG